MYKKILIKGLRGINNVQIDDIKQVNLLVGKNNSGKTTILEGLFLLINPGNPELPMKINNFRDYTLLEENFWRTIFNKLNTNSKVQIYAEFRNPEEIRDLTISPLSGIITSANSYDIIKKDDVDLRNSYSGVKPLIDGLDVNFSINLNNKKRKYNSKITVQGLSIEGKMPKDYIEKLTGLYVRPYIHFGELARIFSNVQVKKGINRVVRILKKIEPSIESLSLGSNGIIYCDIGLDRLMPINVMGGGILKILFVILAISDTEGGIILIDEIENGLHYSSQEILWDAIFESTNEFNAQVFASSHSMECIKAFSSSYSKFKQINEDDNIRLFRIEKKMDELSVISYNHEILQASLESEWEVR
jgi:AAA15 family ATPase/GTPase